MNTDLKIINYLRDREQGLFFSHRRRQLSVQQTLITNNEIKSEPLRDGYPSTSFNTKAFLIVMSVDKSFFAVATSENSVGIYCSISGELVYKLMGSQCPIYTISWHPHFTSIIGCSNVSGSVFVWDICESHEKECHYQKIWSWPPLSSITYAIGFHPFQSIMALARDREIRFIDWEKGVHIGQWRFNGEFSLVSWMSWSFVGSSVITAVGNPPRDGLLASIIDLTSFDAKSMSPMHSGCPHYNNNYLCEICDTCDKMSTLDTGPPKFDQYRVNAVDLIRYVLSRPQDWFVAIFVCVDCRLRFKLWADSIQIHNKYDLEANLTKQRVQLPHDVESANVTVMESPVAPEVVWDLFQKLDAAATTIVDKRLSQYLLPKFDPVLCEQSRTLLRCVAMFERECLRQSICWCCIQQIHYWVLQHDDFPLFLYQSMVQVRQMVIERVKNYDNNIFKMDCKENEKCEQETILSVISDGHIEPTLEIPVKDAGPPDNCPPYDRLPDLCHDNEQPQEYYIKSTGDHLECKELPFSISDLYPKSLEANLNLENDRRKRLAHLHITLKFLQLYVSEPSKLGDLVNTFMDNNLSQSAMLFGPSMNQSKVDSYSVRKWHLQPLGAGASRKIFPRHNLTESHLVVPYLTLSGTGLTESSIRISKCGRTIAVFVPQDSFRRIHSKDLPNHNIPTRKRQYSKAFSNSILTDFPSITKDPVIAIYASEPESSCGQLLYYFEMPYSAISLDFSPLGDHLIVGLSGSQNQSYLFWINSEFAPQSNWSFIVGPPSDSQCNIGLILNINPTGNDPTVKYHSVSMKGPRRMALVQIINHTKSIIRNGFSDLVGLDGPLNCVVWNTAGGVIYSKEPGTLFSLSFVGGKA